jgi:multidrug efflux system membrane fusion protein
VPQQKVANLQQGQEVSIRQLNGNEMSGILSFVSAAADENTRSYYVEVEIDNAEGLRIAGASVTIEIPIPSTDSHEISPALLVLNDDGKPSVFTVDENNSVKLIQVELLSLENKAIVSGLPETVRLITAGGGFVSDGQTVEVRESAE